MKIVIAPDSFKESLSAQEVCQAMEEGVRRVLPQAEVDACPMADGGEGTVEAMIVATGGRLVGIDTFGPLGEPRKASFGLLGNGRIAVIEMAAAAGLPLVPPDRRNPLLTTTFGVGKLIQAALDLGVRELIIGIGGSATVDGGAGCAQALGVVFIDSSGKPCVCGLAGGGLGSIARIDMSDRDERLTHTRVRVACDVTNPLTGPNGAAAIFGPQKGATPEMVKTLDTGLANLAACIRRDLHLDVENLSGAGAAGGLGAGLVAFAGAELQRGVEIVADALQLERRLTGASVVLTGEGKLDGQSSRGKTAFGVATIARRLGVPAICIPGQAADDAPLAAFAQVLPLMSDGVTLSQAMSRTKELLALRAEQAMRALLKKP